MFFCCRLNLNADPRFKVEHAENVRQRSEIHPGVLKLQASAETILTIPKDILVKLWENEVNKFVVMFTSLRR